MSRTRNGRRDRNRDRDTREADKTPLIDVVFLLLIFFFVSLAATSLVDPGEETAEPGENIDWLMEMPDVVEVEGSKYRLLHVQKTDSLHYDFQRHNNVVGELGELQRRMGVDDGRYAEQRQFDDSGSAQYAVFICDDCDDIITNAATKLDSIRRLLNDDIDDSTQLPTLRRLSAFLPYPLPLSPVGAEASDYDWTLAQIKSRLTREKDVHLRLDDSLYYRFVFDIDSLLAQSSQDLTAKSNHVYLRVISER